MKQKLFLLITVIIGAVALTSCCTPRHKHAYMRKTYKKIKRTLKSAQVTNLDDTVKVLFPENIMFRFNSSSIDTNILPSIKRFSNVLNKYNRTAILISGYTDSLGTDQYNNTLSANRADTAKAALLRNEVKTERISTWGMGKRHPVASNHTEEGRARNRRVEFIILYEDTKR